MTRILVTGGAGFIGSYLAHHLTGVGHEVVVLDALRPYAWPDEPEHRAERELRARLIEGAAFEEVDLLDRAAVAEIIAAHQPEIVVHLAANAILSSAEKDPEACERDIVESCRNLLSTLQSVGSVRRLVHASSSMVYGNFESGSVGEDAPRAPVNAYGRMKSAAEELVRGGAGGDIEITIVRPIAVYGPGDFCRRVVTRFCAQALKGETLVVNDSADQLMDFTFVEDEADGIARAALTPGAAGETFNIACGQARSLAELVEAIRSHVPNLRYELKTSSDVNRPKRGALDISKARALLGYSPKVPLEDGVGRCIAFLRGEAGIPGSAPRLEAAE